MLVQRTFRQRSGSAFFERCRRFRRENLVRDEDTHESGARGIRMSTVIAVLREILAPRYVHNPLGARRRVQADLTNAWRSNLAVNRADDLHRSGEHHVAV